MGKKSITDVANALGVSKTLVSLVLNGRGDEMNIKKETQKKVIDMAKKLNYKPNMMARSLRLGSSKTIGFIIPNIGNYFFARIARVIEDEADKYGYRVMSVSSDENPEKEVGLIRMLMDRQIDGLILASSLNDKTEILNLKKENFPFVLIDRYFTQIKSNYVVIDNYQASYDVVSHLIEKGFKRIGLLKYEPSYLSTIKLRCEGYKHALRDHGIRYNKKLVKEVPAGDIENTVGKVLPELLFRPVNADALYFLNNDLTISGLKVISKLGLRIPQDVAIVSFDDLALFEMLYPPITAVAQPWERMAKEAVRILIDEIRTKGKNKEKAQITLPATMKIRRSSLAF